MSKYKEIIILIGLIIMFYISYPIVCLIGWSIDSSEPSKEPWNKSNIKTKYNDNFVFYQKKALKDPNSNIAYLKVYYKQDRKKYKISENTTGIYFSPNIEWEYKSNEAVAYVLNDVEIIYKTTNGKKFRAIPFITLGRSNPIKYKFLIPIARNILKNGSIISAEEIGGFLIKTNDKESIQMIKQNADGKFSDDQKSSVDEDSLEDDIKIFKDMLKEKKEQLMIIDRNNKPIMITHWLIIFLGISNKTLVLNKRHILY